MARKRPSYTKGAAKARRQKMQWRIVLLLLVIAAALFIGANISNANGTDASQRETGLNLTYVKAPESMPSVPVSYMGMDISFNPELHIPNYVAWELTADEVDGPETRGNKFFCDENVAGCPDTWDYSYSGYDRGHMAPAGDMKWSRKAMDETFFLTNICPQSGDLNRGAWKTVEEKCRARAKMDSALYIVCGPVPGEKPIEYIGDSKVFVPRRFFKVICAPYAETPYAIGFIMPNSKVIGGAQKAAVAVDEVEKITGYDFFSELPDDLENQIESRADFNRWSRLK